MSVAVRVAGSGIAAYATAHLLRRGRVSVSLTPGTVGPSPVVMLSTATQNLLRDVFEVPELFSDLHVICRRIVRWGGSGASTISVPHSGVAVAESQLLSRLTPALTTRADESHQAPDWTVICARTNAGESRQHFGTRVAFAYPVTLHKDADSAACYIESVPRGWLFLLPFEPARGSLLCVGSGSDLLDESELVAKHVAGVGEKGSSFPAYPSILDCLATPGSIACGAAAMTFDPLCGEGMGNAIREAILAAAVIRAWQEGTNSHQLVSHFEACLRRGFLRHLQACAAFYAAGPGGAWWDTEQAHTHSGIRWIQNRHADEPIRFRLSGFDLEEIAPGVLAGAE